MSRKRVGLVPCNSLREKKNRPLEPIYSVSRKQSGRTPIEGKSFFGICGKRWKSRLQGPGLRSKGNRNFQIALREFQTRKLRITHWFVRRLIVQRRFLGWLQFDDRSWKPSASRILYQFKYTSKVEFLIFILFFNWILSLYYLKIILFNSKRPFKEKCKIGISYLKGIRAGLKMI